MKVQIDQDRCHRSGECYYNHPELFEMGPDGAPQIREAPELTPEARRLHAEQAAEVCPAVAISIIDQSAID